MRFLSLQSSHAIHFLSTVNAPLFFSFLYLFFFFFFSLSLFKIIRVTCWQVVVEQVMAVASQQEIRVGLFLEGKKKNIPESLPVGRVDRCQPSASVNISIASKVKRVSSLKPLAVCIITILYVILCLENVSAGKYAASPALETNIPFL